MMMSWLLSIGCQLGDPCSHMSLIVMFGLAAKFLTLSLSYCTFTLLRL